MLVLLIAGLVILVDQAVKYWAATYLLTLPGYTYPLWPGVFHLTYAENRGAAFSLLQDARWFFVITTVLACGAIIWFLWRERYRMHTLMRVSLALILGGAIGNFIDRLFLGYVRDMLYAVCIDFAIFNVADSAICIGCALLFIDLLFLKGKRYLEPAKKERPKGEGSEPDKGDGPAPMPEDNSRE